MKNFSQLLTSVGLSVTHPPTRLVTENSKSGSIEVSDGMTSTGRFTQSKTSKGGVVYLLNNVYL